MYKCESMFVLSLLLLLLLLLDCLTAMNEWLPDCLIGWSPYLPIDHGDGGLFWFVLDLHMYNCEIMFVWSFLLFFLLLLLNCLIAWLIDCQIAWLVDQPTSQFTIGDGWYILICIGPTYVQLWKHVCFEHIVVVVLVAWLPDCFEWVALPDCLIGWFTLPPNWPWWLCFILIGIGPTYVQLWNHVCFELVVVVVVVAWLPDCLDEWMPDCFIYWLPYL